jgi:hypothetical protein
MTAEYSAMLLVAFPKNMAHSFSGRPSTRITAEQAAGPGLPLQAPSAKIVAFME